MLVSCNAKVSKSFFEANVGGIGGAIRYTEILPSFLAGITDIDVKQTQLDPQGFSIIIDNHFKDNYAVIMGADIGGVFSKIDVKVESDEFEFKKAKPDSPYQKTESTTDYQYFFSNFRSGEKNFVFEIQLLDLLN